MKSLSTFAMFAGLLAFAAMGCGDQAATPPPADTGAATAPVEEGHADHDHPTEEAAPAEGAATE
ncbi:MAG: hypothetical protein KF861_19430 [Planctomycetaceae bacterium]|nr:hypothetical protein [Planctomycetaceae bacterium]